MNEGSGQAAASQDAHLHRALGRHWTKLAKYELVLFPLREMASVLGNEKRSWLALANLF